MDFLQISVTNASWDKGELTRFWWSKGERSNYGLTGEVIQSLTLSSCHCAVLLDVYVCSLFIYCVALVAVLFLVLLSLAWLLMSAVAGCCC